MTDTDAYKIQLDNVPPNDKTTRMNAAVAMVRDGHSYRRAAEVCGVKTSTLFARANNPARLEREKDRKYSEDELIDSQFAIARRAAELVFDRVDSGEMRDGDLIKAMGVATDKIAVYRQWGKGQASIGDDSGMSALARILQGKTITVTDSDPSNTAIDVTATRGESE